MADEPTPSSIDLRNALRRHLASWLDWFGSRKVKTLLATVLLTVLAPRLGVPPDLVQWILALGGVGVASQGLADFRTGGSRRP